MNEVDVLRTAKGIVSERWTQGSLGYDGEPRCMLGAVVEAIGDIDYLERLMLRTKVVDMLMNTIGRELIPCWNDELGRTREEVVDAFDRAIFAAEQNEISERELVAA